LFGVIHIELLRSSRLTKELKKATGPPLLEGLLLNSPMDGFFIVLFCYAANREAVDPGTVAVVSVRVATVEVQAVSAGAILTRTPIETVAAPAGKRTSTGVGQVTRGGQKQKITKLPAGYSNGTTGNPSTLIVITYYICPLLQTWDTIILRTGIETAFDFYVHTARIITVESICVITGKP
jgi:hypothetical protein